MLWVVKFIIMIYRIFKTVNYADTCRDADDIHITELGYKSNLEDAKSVANKYIKEHFFHKDTELREYKYGTIGATDFCSYGATIEIQPIVVD
jgi:hypothetical protein